MLIFCPDPNVDKCVEILHTSDAAVTCQGIAQVSAVDTEIHPMWHKLQNHPTRVAWKGYEAPMIDYGLRLWEKIKNEPIAQDPGVKDMGALLSTSLDFATSGEFEMEMPPWWSNGLVHLTHLSWIVTAHPGWYPIYLDTDLELGLPFLIEPPDGS